MCYFYFLTRPSLFLDLLVNFKGTAQQADRGLGCRWFGSRFGSRCEGEGCVCYLLHGDPVLTLPWIAKLQGWQLLEWTAEALLCDTVFAARLLQGSRELIHRLIVGI